jgi:hypothetical protein
MTSGVTLEFPSITLGQYDRTCALMGLTPRGAGPAGILFHWSTVTGDGMLITDVWRDRGRFEEFARDSIGPLSREAGVTVEPKVTFDDVHGYFTAGVLGEVTAPVAVVMHFDGTFDQYDEVRDMMGLASEAPGPDGILFHWVTAAEGGMRITDVWQDRATFEAFSETQIGPYSAKVGLAPPTSVTMYDVYNYFTAGA